ncbi:MAG: glycosyl hydrolase family protein [Lachnospiraceae bacterium]|nr:glycosyl hydrolase family protein [Lachnospiraceae bacterium]
MRKRITKLAGVSLLSLSLAVSPLTISGVMAKPDPSSAETIARGYTFEDLVWSDEFDGETLDTDTWNYEHGNNNGWGNNEKEEYSSSPKNVYIADIQSDDRHTTDDGKALAIHAQRETDGTYTSGRIQTSKKQDFKYGRIEAAIKFDNGMQRGVWPAFWMLGDNDPKGWPYCGEIDIMEHANISDVVNSTLHWNIGDEYNHCYDGGKSRTIPYGRSIDDWHIYAFEWNSERLTFFIDDKEIGTINVMSSASDEFNGHEFFFILNVAIGGNYIGGVEPYSTWEGTTMYVDYIRVYQNQSKTPGASYTGTWKKSSIWDNIDKPVKPVLDTKVSYYSDNKVVSTATVTKGNLLKAPSLTKAGYTFGGWYTSAGTAFNFNQPTDLDTLNLYAKWNKVNVAKPKISSLKSKKKKTATIKMSSSEKVAGYIIKYGTNKAVTKKVKTKSTTKSSLTIKSLKSKKTYYFKIQAYKTDSAGKQVKSSWTKAKKVKIK